MRHMREIITEQDINIQGRGYIADVERTYDRYTEFGEDRTFWRIEKVYTTFIVRGEDFGIKPSVDVVWRSKVYPCYASGNRVMGRWATTRKDLIWRGHSIREWFSKILRKRKKGRRKKD